MNGANRTLSLALVLLAALSVTACGGKKSRTPATVPGSGSASAPRPAPAPSPPPSSPGSESGSSLSSFEDGDILSQSLEDLNAASPLVDIHFEFDSAALSEEAKQTLERHAEWLTRYPSVTILIEGHCDERGTVEYNLALGERRAMAAYNYLQSLGVPADRLKTISYGKEFPLDPAHNEAAWARNRRGHFVITSK